MARLTARDMIDKMRAALPERTGKTFEDWVGVARTAGIDKHGALTQHLKAEHGLNHNEAQWIAWGVTDPGRVDQYDRPQDLVAELYSGNKAALRPIHDKLLALGEAMGAEVDVCKTSTNLSTRVQFAIIAARTQKAVDLELALPPDQARAPGLAFKSSNPRFGVRVRIGDVAEVDDQVAGLLRAAMQAVG